MQLVAYGAQDIYLTGNPQITFFKVVYRRHTNFSMEAIEQTVNGSQSSGGSGTVTISRNGDLVHKVYLTTSTAGVTRGSNLFSEVELEIGGQRIDRHYTDWCNVWNELSTNESKALGLKSMQGDIGTSVSGNSTVGSLNLVQVPLQFWFCRNIGLALPLIALQYHEVKLKIVWGSGAAGTGTGTALADCGVICDYIYLDTDERRRFAQVSHEYLIEQVQRQIVSESLSTNGSKSERLNFNHPVKELIWSYSNNMLLNNVQLKLNGHDRFSQQAEPYFTVRQPFEYHTAVPRQNLPLDALRARSTGSLFSLQQSESVNNSISGAAAADAAGANSISTSADGTTFGLNTLFTNADVGTNVDVVLVQTTAAVAGITDVGTGTTGLTLSGQGAGTGTVGAIFVGTVTVTNANSSTIVVPFTNVAVSGSTLGQLTVIRAATQFGSGNESTAPVDAIFTAYVINPDARRSEARTSRMDNKIGVYTFALKPEEHQPSGSCNFSRIDNAELRFENTNDGTMTVYAVNYNVLRIMSGMGGLAYSN